MIARHRTKQRGRHIETTRRHALGHSASGQHRNATLNGALDEALHPLLLVGIDQRAAVTVHSGRTSRRLLEALDHLAHKAVIN